MSESLTKAQKPWKDEIALLRTIVEREGLSMELRNPGAPQYQIARLVGDGVRLIVYPHITRSTGNKHARVRDENSPDKVKAAAIMARMDAMAGFNCTLQRKNKNWDDVLHAHNALAGKEG